MSDIDSPEFSLPFTIPEDGSDSVIEQGSDEEIQQRVFAVLGYELGQRADLPTFGLPDQVFVEGGADLQVITEIVKQWVPDASEVIDSDSSWLSTMIQHISVRKDNGG